MTFVTDHKAFSALMRHNALTFEPVGKEVTVKAFGCSADWDECGYEQAMLHKIYREGLQIKDGLHAMTVKAQQALHEEIASKLLNSDTANTGIAHDHLLLKSVSKCIFFATMKAVFGGEKEGFATDDHFKAFQEFDKKFPFLVGGAPLWAFPDASKGLDAMTKLFEDPSVHLETACSFIIERYHYVSDKLSNKDYSALTSSLIWAAVGNTMPTCYWCLYFLMADKEAMRAIVSEVDAVAADSTNSTFDKSSPLPGARIFSQDALNKMTLLHSTIHEAMRLTSGSIVMRIAKEDTTLRWKGMGGDADAWKVSKGERVCFYPPLHHHDESVFGEDCMEFRHDRFAGAEGITLARDHLLVFGGGVSMCPGRYFAFNEVKAFIATMVSCCKLELSAGQPEPPTSPVIDPSRVGLGIFSPMDDLSIKITMR